MESPEGVTHSDGGWFGSGSAGRAMMSIWAVEILSVSGGAGCFDFLVSGVLGVVLGWGSAADKVPV